MDGLIEPGECVVLSAVLPRLCDLGEYGKVLQCTKVLLIILSTECNSKRSRVLSDEGKRRRR